MHYPQPVHAAGVRRPGPLGSLPETERAAGEVLSLPLYPELPEGDALRVAEAIRALRVPGRAGDESGRVRGDVPPGGSPLVVHRDAPDHGGRWAIASRRAGRLRISGRRLRTGGNLAWLGTRAWGAGERGVGGRPLPLATAYCRRRGLSRVSRARCWSCPSPRPHVRPGDQLRRDLPPGSSGRRGGAAGDAPGAAPRGALLVRVPALERLQSHHDAAVHTRQRYRAAELRRKAEAAGLRVERASYANTVLLPWRAASRLGQAAFRAGRSGTDGPQGGEGWRAQTCAPPRPF